MRHWEEAVELEARPDYYHQTGEIQALIIAPPRLADQQRTVTEFQYLPLQTANKRELLAAQGWRPIWVAGDMERWCRTRANGGGEGC